MGSVFKKAVTRPLPPEGGNSSCDKESDWLDGGSAEGEDFERQPLRSGREGHGAYPRGIEDLLRPPPGRKRRDRRDADRLPRRERRPPSARRAGASGRAGEGELAHPWRSRIAEHLTAPLIGEHVRAFVDSMKSRGVVEMHRENTRRHLEAALMRDCGLARLADLAQEALEKWLSSETVKGRSARSRNAHRTAIVSFANWCVAVGRLSKNPFKGIPKANETADPRRRRRAMTEGELIRLLDVARRRPLAEVLTVRRGKRKGEAYANVRPEVRARLEATGRERALIYKTLVLTGLRKGELASLTVAQLAARRPGSSR